MIKKIPLMVTLTLMIGLAGCSAQQRVGNDTDSHHCLTSAGYQWSQLQDQCVRIFEAGTRLMPINPDVTSAAFVIFNHNQSRAELFVANLNRSVLLKKDPKLQQWRSGQFKLIESSADQWQLYNQNVLSYQSELNPS